MTWDQEMLRQMADWLMALDVNWLAYPIVFAAGLLTNLCPCNVALVPLVIGHAGGFARSKQRGKAFLYSAIFAAGIVSTLCVIGALTSVLGALLAPLRVVCLWLLAVVVAWMGLICLGVLDFEVPGRKKLALGNRKGLWGAFLLGLAAGAVATPCATPVLATILAYVGVEARLLYGLSLLLAYALGFVVPLLCAGAFAGFILELDRWQEKTRYRDWIAKGSGVLLLLFAAFLVKRALD
jgi:cytochrome c-type biogenesis protein